MAFQHRESLQIMSTSSRVFEAAHHQPQVAPRSRAWLALGAVIGPLVFTLGWLVLGAASPGYTVFGVHIAPYSPIAQPISGLGMGVTASYMNVAFVLSGLLMFVGVVGIYRALPSRPAMRWLCAALLALTPLGLIVAGLFNLESPMLHYVGALLGLGSPVLSFLVTGLVLLRHSRLASAWYRAAAGKPDQPGAVSGVLCEFRPGDDGSEPGHRRSDAARPRAPRVRLVRGPGLVCLQAI
jgi:hypothetical protein